MLLVTNNKGDGHEFGVVDSHYEASNLDDLIGDGSMLSSVFGNSRALTISGIIGSGAYAVQNPEGLISRIAIPKVKSAGGFSECEVDGSSLFAGHEKAKRSVYFKKGKFMSPNMGLVKTKGIKNMYKKARKLTPEDIEELKEKSSLTVSDVPSVRESVNELEKQPGKAYRPHRRMMTTVRRVNPILYSENTDQDGLEAAPRTSINAFTPLATKEHNPMKPQRTGGHDHNPRTREPISYIPISMGGVIAHADLNEKDLPIAVTHYGSPQDFQHQDSGSLFSQNEVL